MKTCPVCGSALSDEAQFCVCCGSSVSAQAPVAPVIAEPVAPVTPVAPIVPEIPDYAVAPVAVAMTWHCANCHKNTHEDPGKDKNPLNSNE